MIGLFPLHVKKTGMFLVFLINNDQGFLSGSAVVECLTQDRRAVFSSLTGVTALWSLSKTQVFFLIIFNEIFTSNLGNLCSLFYTDHFLTIVEFCLQNINKISLFLDLLV